ncbi:non-hydrolyzing UDP-N-acetylglucosamine 2-epimerase [Fructilactobacillus fructivorans]|uniref:UDP-N-acetylglucosamine 2-epimerase (non-hydrolyzing) n=1 Tax=Fructilactobacillus fructivorans TaxID=1614 RepID=A0A0C1PKX3_9LACO|nr:UDP-N-acetylglucosamine 2-epimerase (non-hydrolyzing) [Fructilactobacillus fructivorans]KID41342.1 UDP-N-acetylglucosamine 2-epimerase [Fructilactobacillus fructivorans]MCT0151772.1 UDP-N-acetylglucosamine 2-epimerase (non-hydrolyzing) [Fructilactobacillus fructivorans]MCT2867100.1 UDP-N-acetylglucosamine 2-epimerase (non-hydrolyzing) [Fructilactobacillus fructivorans]MCT2868340.1 UDP-N-acetylglucosamine 2-epimerase (non-hydrolyzing) [Fructilactobacillus fructivorans]MCT2873048.1 UDP-N-acet
MGKPIKVMTVFGTRPEAIKMAPIILEMNRHRDQFTPITVVTGQHREMLQQVLDIFKIIPDYNLNIMKKAQTLSDITVSVIAQLNPIIAKTNPDIVLVHGDTTSTFAASVATFYHKKMLGHVEAGLRTHDKYSPYPEEMNRQLTDVLADLYFAPTELSKKNLLKENHPESHIFVTGNTAIDALHQTVSDHYHHSILDKINPKHRIILLTMHRRENLGEPMKRTFETIKEVVDHHLDVDVVYPVHLNPVVQQMARQIFKDDPRIHLIEPLDVVDFHNMAARSYFIMTDSGGVQEEAPSLGKPVLVLRTSTERPEGVKAGTLKLVGTDPQTIRKAMEDLLDHPVEYQKMADAHNPYGDGTASQKILSAIEATFKKES